jgi:2,5-diketo-D-gluconate reductase A
VKAVSSAIELGYRSIDTAAIYQNEKGVGEGIKNSGLKRSQIYLTTKLWNTDHLDAQGALEKSLKLLGVDYLDLYLIHWPSPKKGSFLDAWKALIKIKESGLVKSIGVCNFQISHLDKIIQETGIVPVLNQVELHPQFAQKELRAYHQKHKIITEAWSPLAQGQLTDNKTLMEIGKKHHKSAAQVMLRWQMELGHVTIPKSVTRERIQQNFEIFDFKLTPEEMKLIDGLDRNDGRVGPSPDTADF